MKFLLKILVSTLAVFFTSYLLPGVYIEGFVYAILVALVLSVLNAVVKPILIFLTIPATVVTFGLFLLVINAAIILLAAEIVPGFSIDNFWWALLFSIIVTIINSILERIAGTGKPRQQQNIHTPD